MASGRCGNSARVIHGLRCHYYRKILFIGYIYIGRGDRFTVLGGDRFTVDKIRIYGITSV
jgi:hypothetical protein